MTRPKHFYAIIPAGGAGSRLWPRSRRHSPKHVLPLGAGGQPLLLETYERIAPRVEDWPVLVTQLTTLLKIDYDWSAEVSGLSMPVMIVVGDADGLPPSHAVAFFELLGGGKRDAGWDRSGMTQHRLAVLPGVTHYDINLTPALAETALTFL